jgi:hypothetical protein
MKNLHTPGKITFKSNNEANAYHLLSKNGNWLMSILHNGEAILDRQLANINRMVKCWNYFDGIPTEDIPTSVKKTKKQTPKFHIIYTSDDGPKLQSFKTEKARDKWCAKQDNSFEDFYAVDGEVIDVYNPIIGE